MKGKLVIFLSLILSCSHPKLFVLEDTDSNKYYLSDSINTAFKKGYIEKSPLIAIDGVLFPYQKDVDTITLPLKKYQITSIDFLAKESSKAIYGADAVNGAVVINTIALPQCTTDTIRTPRANK